MSKYSEKDPEIGIERAGRLEWLPEDFNQTYSYSREKFINSKWLSAFPSVNKISVSFNGTSMDGLLHINIGVIHTDDSNPMPIPVAMGSVHVKSTTEVSEDLFDYLNINDIETEILDSFSFNINKVWKQYLTLLKEKEGVY